MLVWLASLCITTNEEHMEAMHRIFGYLNMTPGKGLLFRKADKRNIEEYLMQIRQGRSQIGVLPLVIAPLYGAILLHGEVKRSMWL